MDTSALKKFAQSVRRQLIAEVSAQLDGVLKLDSAEHREKAQAIKALQAQIKATSKEAVIDRVAYIWFNRLCAFRFMDVNHYTRTGIVSPAEGFTLPEILQGAKQGHVDDEFLPFLKMDRLMGFLNGTLPSADPQQEAYRLLLVAACNRYQKLMPFLFERIDDYTELLMPRDLLSESSVLSDLRDVLAEETCKNVEVIGWLYQFYISEKKDEVFEGLQKNKKVTAENIPAATQLFTPHWIVRYLVENSLGRLWMLNHPDSRLAEKMEYYIKPEEPEKDFLKVSSVEDLKFCDPACGSGHMLTYAFDLLYAIYEEEGYQATQIPSLILKNNLFGVEIDERAGELAAFALIMKARDRDRRFLTRGVQPNVCVLENVHLAPSELEAQDWFRDSGPLKADLYHDLNLFHEGKHFGSLLRPKLSSERLREFCDRIAEKPEAMQNLGLMDEDVRERGLRALTQAEYLSPKYHVVVANPPYMGGKGMNPALKRFLLDHYADVKTDLFSAFIMRCSELGKRKSYIGLMSPNVWMYILSYQKLRSFMLDYKNLTSLVELPLSGFRDATVQICAFNFINMKVSASSGVFIGLTRCNENSYPLNTAALKAIREDDCPWRFRVLIEAFNKITGSPIAYWLGKDVQRCFEATESLKDISEIREGINTGNNALFLRLWPEVGSKMVFKAQKNHDGITDKWFIHRKGGSCRKWYGNLEYVLNWENGGRDIHRFHGLPISYNGAPVRGKKFFFREALSWSRISSGKFSIRFYPEGTTYDSTAPSIFSDTSEKWYVLGFMNCKIVGYVLEAISPTLDFRITNLSRLPIIRMSSIQNASINHNVQHLVDCAKFNWDSYETSWDFTDLPLLRGNFRCATLSETYSGLRQHWLDMTLEMQRLEEENNRIFIEAYGLQDELTPDVPLEEITLTCNPHYRYGNNKSEEELEVLLLADTMKEFISYAVGCMFGRYSLDKPGLVLANQGETVEDYLAQVPDPTFPPDEDNVIPILEGEWFSDDITERFKKFLKTTFGEEHYRENLEFIESALGKDVRKYFLKDFYADHVKRYKKRPIYWLFSSPKGGFNALIYMHRYRPDTASVVLNGYLRDFRTKLKSRVEHLQRIEANPSTSRRDQTSALKETEKIKKLLRELDDFERDVLFPLAAEQVEIDLDDGVKANYPKFGKALKPIKGLNDEE